MKKSKNVLGIDLGASSGRGIIGSFDGERLSLREIHRFVNTPVTENGMLCWDIETLRRNVADAAVKGRAAGATALGIDTWGVDYGLLDADGVLLASPVHYRDKRTVNITDYFSEKMDVGHLYGITGIQTMNFNTVFQLAADRRDRPGLLDKADTLLFMPDLFGYYLTGETACEYTIASTGALLDASDRDLSDEVLKAAGVSRGLFAPLVTPGHRLGELLPEYGGGMSVYNVASHDTASAVLSVPSLAGPGGFVYISSGTWSLMGTELTAPRIDGESLKLNWTNEGGAGGTVRFLKNIMGLWLLQESKRQWEREGKQLSFDGLSAAAEASVPFGSIIDPDSPEFGVPGDIPGRIAAFCVRTGQKPPETPGETVRIIFDSLALCYRRTLESLVKQTGICPSAVNIVGGGSKDRMLNRLTADVIGLPVVAGPSEATAAGNILMQLIAEGDLSGIDEARELVLRSFDTQTYIPDGRRSLYDDAYGRFLTLLGK
ncbi:MAG: rhamnulokinase [Clostridia bacterium]|nr:rhamnulokinase [Clostridia bacterium]